MAHSIFAPEPPIDPPDESIWGPCPFCGAEGDCDCETPTEWQDEPYFMEDR